MKTKKLLSLVLAVLMILSAFPLLMISTTAAGNVCKIGATEYATFDAAIKAAKDGDTITLLADASTSSSNLAVKGNITIDGAGHKLTAGNGYLWIFYKGATIKNITIQSQRGFRFRYNPEFDTTVRLENVTWNFSTGLLVNIQNNDLGTGNGGSKTQTFEIVNSTITKANGSDPMIATYTNADTVVTVNVENSNLTNGSTHSGHLGNGSMFYFFAGLPTLNVKGNSVLDNRPTNMSGGATSMINFNVPANLNLEAGVKLVISSVHADATKNYFVFTSAGKTVQITDAGATWAANNSVITKGVLLPTDATYNGRTIAAMPVVEAGDTESKFGYFTSGEGDLGVIPGACIRIDDPMGISFSATIDASFYNELIKYGEEVNVSLFLITKKNADRFMQDGELNINLIAERNKLEFNKIYISDSEDGQKKVFRGCYYDIEDVTEEYAVIGILTYYFGNELNTIAFPYNAEENVRSVYGVASEALEQDAYASNEYLQAIVAAGTPAAE